MHNPNVKIHSVQSPLSFCSGGEELSPQPNFQKKEGGGLTRPSLLEGVAGKEEVIFFRGRGLQFSHKKKLKFEIFNDKKS